MIKKTTIFRSMKNSISTKQISIKSLDIEEAHQIALKAGNQTYKVRILLDYLNILFSKEFL